MVNTKQFKENINMKKPIAKIEFENRGTVVVELLPDFAPNTVASVIDLAMKGCFDNFAIERIVPGCWIDCSYRAFGKEEAKYFLENEAAIQDSKLINKGMMCVGGYTQEDGSIKIAGGEFYFPMRECQDLTGKYPIIGHILEGIEILEEIAEVECKPVVLECMPDVIITTPLDPVVIETFTVELNDYVLVGPDKKEAKPFPENWL